MTSANKEPSVIKIGGSPSPIHYNNNMKTIIICLEDIRFNEDEVGAGAVERHVPALRAYRNQWKEYNLAKKGGQNPKLPEFPFKTIRVYELDGVYLPIDANVSAILFAARKVKINRVMVTVQEVVVNHDDVSIDEPPIHANRFFDDFMSTVGRLQSTDRQRIVLFKPLIMTMMFNEGFTDESCRTELMVWAKAKIEQYLSRTNNTPKPLLRPEGTTQIFTDTQNPELETLSMPTLTQAVNYRLYPVVETPDAEGNYVLGDFELEDRNREFSETQTQEELHAATDYLLGGGDYCRIDDGVEFDGDDSIRIDLGNGDSLSVPDIREQIDADPEKTDYYIIVNQEYTEYRWIVCERQGTTYRGYEAVAKEAEEQVTPPPLPPEDDIYELDGYATDIEGNLFLDPNGNQIKTEDMFRKVKAQSWDA